MTRTILVILVGSIWSSAQAAETRAPQCVVIGVRGEWESFAVERGEDRLAPVAYQILYEGDRVVVGDPQGEIVLRCGSRDVRVRASDADFVVEKIGSPPTVSENLLRWMSGFLAEWSAEAAASDATVVVVRGRKEEHWPLEVPLLTARAAFVASGRSWIALGWRGGGAPYEIRLYDPERRIVVARADSLPDAHAMLALREPLPAGSFEFEIIDRAGRYVRAPLEVVPPARLPSLPDALGGSPDDVSRTTSAAWIASTAEGIFALEAYQLAAQLAEEHAPARQLVQALRMGRTPPRPP